MVFVLYSCMSLGLGSHVLACHEFGYRGRKILERDGFLTPLLVVGGLQQGQAKGECEQRDDVSPGHL